MVKAIGSLKFDFDSNAGFTDAVAVRQSDIALVIRPRRVEIRVRVIIEHLIGSATGRSDRRYFNLQFEDSGLFQF